MAAFLYPKSASKKQQQNTEHSKNSTDGLIDLSSSQLSDFNKMNLVLKNFDNISELSSKSVNKRCKKQLDQLVDATEIFQNNFNFQYRFIVVSLKLGLIGFNLTEIGVLKRVISAFSLYRDKSIIFKTSMEVFYTQVNFKDSVDLMKSENLIQSVLASAAKTNLKNLFLTKCYEVMSHVFDEKCLGKSLDYAWLVEEGTKCLIMSRNWAGSEKDSKTAHILHFLVKLSRFPVFSPHIFKQLKLLLDGFGDFLLEILTIFENLLAVNPDRKYHRKSGDFLGTIAGIILGKPGNTEVFVKTLKILLKFFDYVNKEFLAENFAENLVLIIKMHADRKLIAPVTKDLLKMIFLGLIASKPPIEGLLKTAKRSREAVLRVTEDKLLEITVRGEDACRLLVDPSSTTGVTFNYDFHLDDPEENPEAERFANNGLIKLEIRQKTITNKIKKSNSGEHSGYVAMLFKPIPRNLVLLNQIVELLVVIKELNF